MSECYKIPHATKLPHRVPQHEHSDDESCMPAPRHAPPDLPEVPQEIATPAAPYVPPDIYPRSDPICTPSTTDEFHPSNAADI